MGALLQDLKYAVRTLAKSPAFTAVAVLTLALGIGANTAIFSVVDAVLLRPLPYRDADRLLWVSTHGRYFHNLTESSGPDFLDWSRQNHVFDSMAAFVPKDFIFSGEDEASLVTAVSVSAGFFKLMRVSPVVGREFLPGEYQEGQDHAVLLSYSFWQRRFGGEANVVGKSIALELKSYTVVGVMPRGFDYPFSANLWAPLVVRDDSTARGAFGLEVMARLKPGVTLRQAQLDMDTITRRIDQENPDSHAGLTVSLAALRQHMVGEFEQAILVLLGAVGLVVLLACANVANLLLVRNAARQREIALRGALGAGRWRVIRHLITESALLSLLGGGLGILVALWGLDVLVKLIPGTVPGLEGMGLSGSVLAFSAAVTILTTFLFGLGPALWASKLSLVESLKAGSRSLTEARSHRRLRALLVVSEVALAFILSIGGGLLFQSFVRLEGVSTGFDPDHVLSFWVSLSEANYPKSAQQETCFHQILERVRSLPGVRYAALVSPLPFSGGWGQGTFEIEGGPAPAKGQEPVADLARASPDYFRAMGIPLLRGRFFTDHDDGQAPKVAIIDEKMAHTFWGNDDPIGRRIKSGEWLTIVGVVGHVKTLNLARDPGPQLYGPYAQSPTPDSAVVVKTSIDPAGVVSAVRREMRAIDKDLPVYGVETMQERLDQSTAAPRFRTLLMGIFAGLALVLAAVGIYGVMAYSVATRRHEVGVRVALGARSSDVVKLVLGHSMVLTLVGVAIGFGGGLTLTRFLSSLLYDVRATDPATFVAVAVVLGGVALAASYIPARRATKVDPMVALRCE